jgi:hypothetical protein
MARTSLPGFQYLADALVSLGFALTLFANSLFAAELHL